MTTERKDNMVKYTLLEAKLTELIANTGNEEMMNVFLDWQQVRNELNEEFTELFKPYINDKGKTI